MSNQPWLDSLSDDWVSLPGTPTSPAPPRSPINSHSRRSSVQITPSRIPVPARRSIEPSPSSDTKKKIPRPCHHIRREPPTPKTPRTPKTPSKPRSPYPNISNPKPNPTPGRKKQSVMDGKSPLRSVSNASSQVGQQSTVQIRPKKETVKQGTPEWRKRLVNGDIPAGEQRDLFAPIGLESVFKPPSPSSPLAGSTPIPQMKQPDDGWNFSANSAAEKKGKSPGRALKSGRGSVRMTSGKSVSGQGSRTMERHGKQTTKPRTGESQQKKQSAHLSEHMTESHGDQTDTAQMRSASGLEDLRNEDITPITFSRTNTVDGEGTAEIIKSALKQVTAKLEKLQLAPAGRPNSRASDSVLYDQQNDIAADAAAEEDLLDVTSHSLPQDLSMGTLDYRGRSAFTSLQGDSYAEERSFHNDQLSPTGFPSHRLTPFIRPSTRVRSSPPFYNKSNPQTDPLSLPRPSSAHVAASPNNLGGMPSSGSPLKLFANHDTFTNNKLLRRMSQFEETLGEQSDGDEPVSPSEEARRKGENRNFLHPGERLGRRQDHSRSRNSQTPRINRFGEGQLDNFDFSDTSPYDMNFLHTDSPEPNIAPPGSLLAAEGKFQRGRSYRQTSGYSEASNGTNLLGRRDIRPKLKTTPSSPVKDPTPKRRRMGRQFHGSMLGDATIEDSEATDDLSLLQRSLMQHGLRYDENEEGPFSESTNRPRTPTPHQSGSFERKQSSPNRRTHQAESDKHGISPQTLTQNVPNVIGRSGKDEVRKGSITTQDFLNEATKVMNLIRSKGTAKSSLSRVDETDTEEHDGNESYEEESTLEEFSRPPSREGIDLRRLREPKEPNPCILSHLKKFQEHDDLEFGVSGSVTSLHLGGDDSGRGDADRHRKRKLPTPPATQEDDLYDFLRLNTETSSKNFSARSVQTGSSQGSHAKGVLSSNIVSHLIPEQVNGFTYDRLRHLWVKEDERKSPSSQQYKDRDEDPFKDIPDLSVDEMEEMMRTENASSPRKRRDSSHTGATAPHGSKENKADDKGSDPIEEDAPGAPSVNLSSGQSGTSQLNASNPTSSTRETSWGTEAPKSTASSDVEHEIKLHEGRLSKPPHLLKNQNHQPRVVTISFSSPLVSQIEYSDDDSPSKLRRIAVTSQAHVAAAENPALQSFEHEQGFSRRSISKIDEQNEDTVEDQSLVPRTPDELEPRSSEGNLEESLAFARENGLDTSYSFHLSPLPDFTVNQIDQPSQLDVSYVAQRTHPTSLRQIHGTFALATEDLVRNITEAEPYEPFWEHLRRLILCRKGLITLHKLADFCPRLEELDVSENDIGQLGGVPSTLRNLKIQNNCLSNLTAWGHLGNLQYLDISGNELENLDAVSGLIHLRELIADNNNIRNIEGVFGLNGLLTLKLRNNRLASIDFKTADMTRLGELDLSHNELVFIGNIQHLSALSQLDLSSNRLETVSTPSPLTKLRALRVSNNRLRSLNVGLFPALTLLYADQNCLSTILGLDQNHGLEVLSVREQEIPDGESLDLDLGLLKDIRKVFLSSNKLSPQTLSPSAPLLSLQLLDVATCSLKALPIDFATKFPNIRVLNLNFNSLEGVNELLGMNCLSRLTVAGNSISRLRRICQVLSRIGRTSKSSTCTLQKVDIRHNPLTVRFYPPALTGSGKPQPQKLISNEGRRSGHSHGLDLDLPLMEQLEREGQLLQVNGEDGEDTAHADPEIDDPYTLPPADLLLDQKYLAHLDQATRLKRRVFELMLYAGTGGAIKVLDGLDFRPVLEPGSDMNQAWARLERLGVLKKKTITG
ncbi:hypothetical protein BDW60DRAFT_206435 [Aspergillus nidulans var. acristatus]